nr:MAG TPA: hypothetical protein [Bacteriophage sp.]
MADHRNSAPDVSALAYTYTLKPLDVCSEIK